MSSAEGAIGFTITNQQVSLNPQEGVRFKLGNDRDISVSIRHGELHVHSHAWSKDLAAIGESGNVLRLRVVAR